MNNSFKNKAFALAVTVLGMASFTTQASVCKDDPRMFTIKTVIDQIDAGESVDPMKLTPQTFLELTDNVRAKLGDNIRVYNEDCVPMQVFEGKIAKPISVPYPILEDSLHRAGLRGDMETINVIFQQFRPEPEEPHSLVYMTRPLTWSPDAVSAIYKAGIVEKRPIGTEDKRHFEVCSKIESEVTQADLFSALGGRATKEESVIFNYYGESATFGLPDKRMNTVYAKYYKIGTKKEYCGAFDYRRTSNSLQKAGLNVERFSERRDKDAFEEYHEKITNAGQ